MGNEFQARLLRNLMGATAVSCVAIATPALAQTRNFDVPVQSASKAISTFARQAGIQLIAPAREVRSKRTNAVKGSYTVEEALRILLQNTGLEARRDGTGIITVRSVGNAPSPIADSGETSGDEGSSGEEIVVTGTLITGQSNRTVSVSTITSKDIEASGYSSAAKVIEVAPQNFSQINEGTPSSFNGLVGDSTEGSSVNLRGVGAGTTLTLINGRRIAPGYLGTAADISAIPLTAVDRIEILPDGASALYGSDAVGGVVNFILKEEISGLNSRARVGFSEGGYNEYRLAQDAGTSWSTGNILASVEYFKHDILPTSSRSFVPPSSLIGSLLPEVETVSGLLNGEQEIGVRTKVYGTALYSRRNTFSRSGRVDANVEFDSNIDQASLTAGVQQKIGSCWNLYVEPSYSFNHVHSVGKFADSLSDYRYGIYGLYGKLDGTLLELPAGPVRIALGAERRWEKFNVLERSASTKEVFLDIPSDRTVTGFFFEAYAPIISPALGIPLIRRLELSLAGRNDSYSNAPSSFDPKIGAFWEVAEGLELRGSYGTSYKAPNLRDFIRSANVTTALFSNAGGTRRYVLTLRGNSFSSLRPQSSDNYSVGATWRPSFEKRARLGINFYSIKYVDRITSPANSAGTLLSDPTAYAQALTFSPSAALVNSLIAQSAVFVPFAADGSINTAFDPSSVDVIADLRTQNIAQFRTSGLDFSASFDADAFGGKLGAAVIVTHILTMAQRLTPTANETRLKDTIYNPADWKGRFSIIWANSGTSVASALNWTDSYSDVRTSPVEKVRPYLTVDLNVSHRFENGALKGLRLSAGATNIFDRQPPSVAALTPSDLGFDPTNASPLGRSVFIEISKEW